MLAALAAEASVVVTDDYPAFMLPRMVQAAANRVAVRFEAIDGNGLLPMRLPDHAFPTAQAFRRFLQQTLPAHVAERPASDPLKVLPQCPAPAAEGFLDQIVTWRALGFNMCVQHPAAYDRYESLPAWAQATLGKHEADPRTYRYGLEAFERGATHDPLWKAAQGQLRQEGRIHNYVRMLWGKKILEWTDGRDPNSHSGIFWTLSRYDRPWGPERPVFGTVRYMSFGEHRAKDVRDGLYSPVRARDERCACPAGAVDLN